MDTCRIGPLIVQYLEKYVESLERLAHEDFDRFAFVDFQCFVPRSRLGVDTPLRMARPRVRRTACAVLSNTAKQAGKKACHPAPKNRLPLASISIWSASAPSPSGTKRFIRGECCPKAWPWARAASLFYGRGKRCMRSTKARCSGFAKPVCKTLSTSASWPSRSAGTVSHKPGNTSLRTIPAASACKGA